MIYAGVLRKMQTEFGNPIQYYLIFENDFLNVNQLISRHIEITFLGYQCLNCGKKKKIFRQGFCYDCFYSSPAVGDWILKPELSTAHLGIADRDLAYEEGVQLKPHLVYLALSTEVKVGVTRKTQVPTRWIDQGASQAISVVEVPNRYLAGITEVVLKNHFVDKTNWRKMLSDEVTDLDLIAVKNGVKSLLPDEVQKFFQLDADLFEMKYPILEFPKKINSLKIEQSITFSGILKGIKGQYLIFEDGTVFNVRSNEGFVVSIKV